jgi:DNA-binding beta-propeller fold protein YncE
MGRPRSRSPRLLAAGVLLGAGLLLAVLGCSSGASAGKSASARVQHATRGGKAMRRYEYVFPDRAMYVYDIGAGQRLVERVQLPMAAGMRGVVASTRTHRLYISYGGDGGSNGDGSMLAYDLISRRVLWQRHYTTGIDSMAITPNGRFIYMPTGELSSSGAWSVIDARDGSVVGSISAGSGPHNTVMSLDGRRVYLGGRNSD